VSGRLEGRSAVVVGGGQTPGETVGNGRAAALLYAREGARVLVVDRDVDAAEDTANQIRSEGGSADAYRADITSERDCAELAAAASDRVGTVNILHNNVGIVSTKRTEDLPVAEWQRVIDVNLTGMWQTTKFFLPLLRDSGNGVVINISSLAGLMAGGQAIAYSTAKAAVNALTRSLALEYAPQRVRVNCIAPGMVDTPLGVDDIVRATGQARDEVVASRSALIPMGRQGTAWDVARAALFLASDDAAFITGVVLPVDGGSSLGTAPKPPLPSAAPKMEVAS
jgi:NAD(P)-dependent dehydrogenase (short-subunit alcohol dehydrogenase family)